MNINDESCYTFMLYLWMLIQEHMINLYGSGFGRVIREVFVWLLLA
jgi:hypothetical protein